MSAKQHPALLTVLIVAAAALVAVLLIFTHQSSQNTAGMSTEFSAAPHCDQAGGCHTSTCGDGVKNEGEQCDDGASNGACPNACSASCTLNNCSPA